MTDDTQEPDRTEQSDDCLCSHLELIGDHDIVRDEDLPASEGGVA